MKTREQLYKKDAEAICRDISEYHVLMEAQLLRLYPKKKRVIPTLLNYLCRQGRICKQGDQYAQAPMQFKQPDDGLLKALWVLVDLIDRVEYHATANKPAKIIFAIDGQVYEIVYVPQGSEKAINPIMAEKYDASTRYMVLVDQVEQIPLVEFPNIWGYCTVSPTGEVQYYEKEEVLE